MRARRRHRRRGGARTRAGLARGSQALARRPAARRDSRRPSTGCAARGLWVAAERLPQVAGAAIRGAAMQPADRSARRIRRSRLDAATTRCVELLRSRLAGLGPVTARDARRAARPAACRHRRRAARAGERRLRDARPLHAAAPTRAEWCERHLLARIHRYTLKRLRREIEPVEPRDFMRFLFDWQHVGAGRARQRARSAGRRAGAARRLRGAGGGVGSRNAAGARRRLRDRLARRSVHRGPHRCGRGCAPAPAERRAARQRARCAPRRSCCCRAAQLGAVDARSAPPRRRRRRRCRSRAQRVAEYLREHGASFFDELADGAHLLRTELEDALAELVARGRVHCDSFAGLRALLVPASKRPSAHRAARAGARRCSASRMRAAGR